MAVVTFLSPIRQVADIALAVSGIDITIFIDVGSHEIVAVTGAAVVYLEVCFGSVNDGSGVTVRVVAFRGDIGVSVTI